ncbi:MAG: hypothetical protein ACI86X_001485 [Moritella sp.]
MAINAAYEIGKRANFTVFSDNIYHVAPEQLRSLPVLGTVVDGVYYPIQAATTNKRALTDQDTLKQLRAYEQDHSQHAHGSADSSSLNSALQKIAHKLASQ